MKNIYIINGSGGVGKDTFCYLVGKYVPVSVISSVDPIKQLAREIGWDGQKTERDRKFLSDLKDLTTDYNDYPMQYMKKSVSGFLNSDSKCLFIHIREPKEIEKAVKEFGAKTILVINSNVKQISTNHADANVTEYNYDIIIDNSGTLNNLDEMARAFCKVEELI